MFFKVSQFGVCIVRFSNIVSFEFNIFFIFEFQLWIFDVNSIRL